MSPDVLHLHSLFQLLFRELLSPCLCFPCLHELCAPSSICSSVVTLEVEMWGSLWAVQVGAGPQTLCP